MAVLWFGGEDVCFPNGAVPVVDTGSTHFRSGWARCAINTSIGSYCKSTVFPGGAVTSAWLRFYMVSTGGPNGGFLAGFGKSGTNSAIGLGQNSSPNLTISSYVNGTRTDLATSTVGSSTGRYDLQLINYGSSGTINVYLNGALILTYTGNLSLSGVTGFDSVFFSGSQFGAMYFSEFIVSDESTLAWQGLVTYAPSGNGTSQQFSNPAYTNFNPTTINDSNSTYTNTTGQDEQATINSGPSGVFQIQAVKVIARALATAGATASNLKLGFNNTNNSTVAEGSSHSLSTGFGSVEDYFTTDPTTGTAWGASLSGYQLELRSA